MLKPRLIIIGNTVNCDIGTALLESAMLDVIGGIVDDRVVEKEEQRQFLVQHGIDVIKFEDVPLLNADVALIIRYSSMIDTGFFKKIKLLNIHAGYLPKWRGMNSNAWAIINGEKEVAYTLHEATMDLDGGDVYRRFVVPVSTNDKYGEVIPVLREQVINELPQVLCDICAEKITPASQKGQQFLYTPKLRKDDGYIKDWNVKTAYIYGLYRVMAAPYGSGIFFAYRGQKYEITEMEAPSIDDYIGIAGAIVRVFDGKMWVKTADNVIQVNKVVKDGAEVDISATFILSSRIG